MSDPVPRQAPRNPEAITCLKKGLTQETDPRVRGKTKAVIKYLEMFEKE